MLPLHTSNHIPPIPMRLNIKSILPIIAAVITLIMAVSCGHRPTRDALERADALIDEHEDSAYKILSELSPSEISDKSDYALYGLLMTQALDKLHLPLTIDTFISRATRYYTMTGNEIMAMRAWYYNGRTNYQKGRYEVALGMFFRAKDIAIEHRDFFWAGLACRGITHIYNASYNRSEELQYAKNAYDNFIKSKKWLYARYALLDLAIAYYMNEKYDKSVSVAKIAIDSAINANDLYLLYGAKRSLGRTLLCKTDFDSAVNVMEEVCRMEDAQPEDLVVLAHSYVAAGMPDKAVAILDSVEYDDLDYVTFVRFQVNKSLNNKDQAIKEADIYMSNKIASIYQSTGYNLSYPLLDYYGEINKNMKNDLKGARFSMWSIFLIAIIALAVGWWVTSSIIHAQKIKLGEQLNAMCELQAYIKAGEDTNSKQKEIIKKLFASKYEMIVKLCDDLIRIPETKAMERKVVKELMSFISSLTSDKKKLKTLADQVDEIHDGLYSDFCRDLPNLKDSDYRLYLFTIFGFPNSLIATFLKEENIKSIYDRKRRLKDKIKQLTPAQSERYMSYLI